MPRAAILLLLPAASLLCGVAVTSASDGSAAVRVFAAKGSPREVSAFLRRRASCSRLSEANSDDPDSVAESVKARFAMKCGTIDDDERRLRARFADDPDAIEALNQNDD